MGRNFDAMKPKFVLMLPVLPALFALPALLVILMGPAANVAPAAVAMPDREMLVAEAEVIVVGELQPREDADGKHRAVIVVAESLAGDAEAGTELPVAWAPRPTNLPPGLEHTAGYVFSPQLEGKWIFILTARDDDSPFRLDHGRQVDRDNLEEVKTLVAKGLDRDFIGKTEAEAARLAEEREVAIRVMKRDDEAMIGTADYRTDRVNLEIRDGVVVRTYRG